MPSSILLKNATILVPTSDQVDDVVALRHHSLLIEGNKMAQIASEITLPSPETNVLDCTGKNVSPGFIDTHHHVWQTQLKGRHADHTLIEYMPTGTKPRRSPTLLYINHRRKPSASPLRTRGYILGPAGRLS